MREEILGEFKSLAPLYGSFLSWLRKESQNDFDIRKATPTAGVKKHLSEDYDNGEVLEDDDQTTASERSITLWRLEDIDPSYVLIYLKNRHYTFMYSPNGPVRKEQTEHREGSQLRDSETGDLISYSDVEVAKIELTPAEAMQHKQRLILLVRMIYEHSLREGIHYLALLIFKKRCADRGKVPKHNEVASFTWEWRNNIWTSIQAQKAAGSFYKKSNFKTAYKVIFENAKSKDYPILNVISEFAKICSELNIDISKDNPRNFMHDTLPYSVVTCLPSNRQYFAEVLEAIQNIDEADFGEFLGTVQEEDEIYLPADFIPHIIDRLQYRQILFEGKHTDENKRSFFELEDDKTAAILKLLKLTKLNIYPDNEYEFDHGFLYAQGRPFIINAADLGCPTEEKACLVHSYGFLMPLELISTNYYALGAVETLIMGIQAGQSGTKLSYGWWKLV